MSRWFRFHTEAMRHPKVARLSDKEFRLWVLLLSVASGRDGVIPCLDDLKHVLNRRLDHLSTGVERLLSMGLIERLGDCYTPHNWGKYQYKSDVSTDRVKRHREKRNVSETPPDTDTDTDTEVIEAKASSARAKRVDTFLCPNGVDPVDWDALKANRKAKRAALTEGAYRQITAKLNRWQCDGWPPGPVVAYAAERGWTTVFETDEMKGQSNAQHRTNGKSGDGAIRALDRQLGLGQPAGTAGRRDIFSDQEYSQPAITSRPVLR